MSYVITIASQSCNPSLTNLDTQAHNKASIDRNAACVTDLALIALAAIAGTLILLAAHGYPIGSLNTIFSANAKPWAYLLVGGSSGLLVLNILLATYSSFQTKPSLQDTLDNQPKDGKATALSATPLPQQVEASSSSSASSTASSSPSSPVPARHVPATSAQGATPPPPAIPQEFSTPARRVLARQLEEFKFDRYGSPHKRRLTPIYDRALLDQALEHKTQRSAIAQSIEALEKYIEMKSLQSLSSTLNPSPASPITEDGVTRTMKKSFDAVGAMVSVLPDWFKSYLKDLSSYINANGPSETFKADRLARIEGVKCKLAEIKLLLETAQERATQDIVATEESMAEEANDRNHKEALARLEAAYTYAPNSEDSYDLRCIDLGEVGQVAKAQFILRNAKFFDEANEHIASLKAAAQFLSASVNTLDETGLGQIEKTREKLNPYLADLKNNLETEDFQALFI